MAGSINEVMGPYLQSMAEYLLAMVDMLKMQQETLKAILAELQAQGKKIK